MGEGQAMPSSRGEGQPTEVGPQALAGHLFGRGGPRAGVLGQEPFPTPSAELLDCGGPIPLLFRVVARGKK